MRDQIDGRLWAEHGHLFSEQVAAFGKAAFLVFSRWAARFGARPQPPQVGRC